MTSIWTVHQRPRRTEAGYEIAHIVCLDQTRGLQCHSTAVPVLLCETEAHNIKNKNWEKLLVFERRVLSKIFGPVRDENCWRRRKLHVRIYGATWHHAKTERSETTMVGTRPCMSNYLWTKRVFIRKTNKRQTQAAIGGWSLWEDHRKLGICEDWIQVVQNLGHIVRSAHQLHDPWLDSIILTDTF